MTSAAVLSAGSLRIPKVAAKSPLRLLPAKAVAEPLARHAPVAHRPEPAARREGFALVLLVAALHGIVAWGVLNRAPTTKLAAAPQEIELIRPPVVEPEPPKPPPPQPKVVQPPRQTATPPALRTDVAQEPQPNTMTVPENLTAERSTGPVVAAPPAPKVEEPIVEANGAAAYLNNPPPLYPRAAQRLGLQGRVLLRVFVLANGRVGNVEVRTSSGKALLDDAALTAVKAWVFTPAKRGATALDGWTNVPIEFKLS